MATHEPCARGGRRSRPEAPCVSCYILAKAGPTITLLGLLVGGCGGAQSGAIDPPAAAEPEAPAEPAEPSAPAEPTDLLQMDVQALYGAPPTDDDGDGVPAWEDCDDNNASVYPCAEDPEGDGLDQNCDGADGIVPEKATDCKETP